MSAPPLGRQGGGPPFELPLLEDANAVQVALQRVMQAIINDEIDNRKAGLLLYALQTASSNLKNTRFEAYALKEQAQTEYANADPAEDDDPDACDICAYGDEEEEEDKEEDNEEDEQEGSEEENEEEDEEKEEQQPAAQQPATQPPAAIPAGREPTAEGRQQGLSPKLPPRSSPLPEHDEELDDEELIKAIRHLAGLT